MRLVTIPKQVDYYDSYLYLSDKDIIYNRNYDLLEYNKPQKNKKNSKVRYIISKEGIRLKKELDSLRIDSRINHVNFLIIGKIIIPYIILERYKTDYIFSKIDLESSINYSDYTYNDRNSIKELANYVTDNNSKTNLLNIYNKVREISKIPIINFKYNSTLNPIISEIGSLKNTISPLNVIQELELYINELDIREIKELDNNTKIKKSGFNVKTSFRKGK